MVFFDRTAYVDRSMDLDPLRWFDEQQSAEADRILTPGALGGIGA